LPKVRLGFLFDMYAWFLLFEEFGFDLSDIKQEAMRRILYTAAVSAARDQGKRVWFTADDIDRFIETVPTKESNAVITTLKNSQDVIKEFTNKVKTDGVKKK
jgi:hypothetical protein